MHCFSSKWYGEHLPQGRGGVQRPAEGSSSGAMLLFSVEFWRKVNPRDHYLLQFQIKGIESLSSEQNKILFLSHLTRYTWRLLRAAIVNFEPQNNTSVCSARGARLFVLRRMSCLRAQSRRETWKKRCSPSEMASAATAPCWHNFWWCEPCVWGSRYGWQRRRQRRGHLG